MAIVRRIDLVEIDERTTRGIVLWILKSYGEPSAKTEKEIEASLPMLRLSRDPVVRMQAAHASRLWMGLRDRDPIRHERLIFYRLRHLDNALNDLERMTRPKRKKAQ